MAAKVFISYRRDDSAGHAGRLHDRLESVFGRDLLFMDVDAIPLGADFVQVLADEVEKCDVLLAIIGPGWLDARDEQGIRRLDNPADFVRIEISTALARGIPVIPILLDGTRVPKPNQLPADLQALSRRNGLDVRHASFHADVDRLIRHLQSGKAEPLPPIRRSAPEAAVEIPAAVVAPPRVPVASAPHAAPKPRVADAAPRPLLADAAPKPRVADAAPQPLLADAAPTVAAEFEALFERNDPTEFLIVEDAQGNFVQFTGAGHGKVMLDLPRVALLPEEIKRANRLLGPLGAENVPYANDASFNVILATEPRQLASFVIDLFRLIFDARHRPPLQFTRSWD